jgi:hypothetical protein
MRAVAAGDVVNVGKPKRFVRRLFQAACGDLQEEVAEGYLRKKMTVQSVQSLRSVQAVQADQCPARTKFKYPLPSGCLIDFGFWIPTESPLKSRNQFATRPLFSLSSSQTKFRLPLELLATTVRLAPTTHLGERSLPIGDELLKVR